MAPSSLPPPLVVSSLLEVVALALSAIAVAVGGVALWRRRRTVAPEEPFESGGSRDETTDAVEVPDSTGRQGDHERVREILRTHGGRARQTAIVDETGWSKAKVSAVVAEMDDEDELSKLRVGRENLVSLPGHEPEAADSPHEN